MTKSGASSAPGNSAIQGPGRLDRPSNAERTAAAVTVVGRDCMGYILAGLVRSAHHVNRFGPGPSDGRIRDIGHRRIPTSSPTAVGAGADTMSLSERRIYVAWS